MLVLEFKRGLRLVHCAHRKAADMAVLLLVVTSCSLFWKASSVIGLGVCVWHVLVLCDDGGCARSDVGRCGHPHG